jgi:hypothetical protein
LCWERHTNNQLQATKIDSSNHQPKQQSTTKTTTHTTIKQRQGFLFIFFITGKLTDEGRRGEEEGLAAWPQGHVNKGLAHGVKLKKTRLLELLKYHFADTTKGLQQIKIKELIKLINFKALDTRNNSAGATGSNYSGLDT